MYASVPANAAVEGRPFTEPARCDADFEIMGFMVQMLQTTDHAGRTNVGSGHQMVVSQPTALHHSSSLIVVGFFGHIRTEADKSMLSQIRAVDEALIAEFPSFPGLLSYTSLQLPGGDWGNLAVFSDMKAMDAWYGNPTHLRAIRELAPRHYETVRLHVAHLAGGLETGKLRMLRTRFYQFEEGSVWSGCCQRSAPPTE